ncbi:MAG: SMC family ATPase [Fimbriimonadia bacterium]|nr:SMC family ATPase [Fimbriimonadia bacterium]
MRLIELELENFRQFSRAVIPFQSGVTAIIGSNGAGKTTLFEGVIWAIYGSEAKRGDNQTLRNLWSDSNRVSARLEFELGGERYQVKRTLSEAHVAVWREQGWVSLATGLGPVTKKAEEILGMNLRQFETSFCAQQKELEFMAYEKDKRREEISRMLGYERLSKAIETLKNDLTNLRREIAGLKEGLGNPDHLKEQLAEVDEKIQEAEAREQARQTDLNAVQQQLEKAKPQKELAEQKKKTLDTLNNLIEQLKYRHEQTTKQFEQTKIDWKEIEEAHNRINELREIVKTYQTTRERLREMDDLAAHETERASLITEHSSCEEQKKLARARIKELEEKEQQLQDLQPQLDEHAQWEKRLTQLREESQQANQRARLEASAQQQEKRLKELQKQLVETENLDDELKAQSQEQQALQADLKQLETEIDKIREEWNRQKAECKANYDNLTKDTENLTQRRDRMQSLGKEGECPTCGQALGDSFENAIFELEDALNQTETQRLATEKSLRLLESEPESFSAKREQHTQYQEKLRACETTIARLTQQQAERERQHKETKTVQEELDRLRIEIDTLPTYDPEEEKRVSEQLNKLAPVRTKETELRAEIRQKENHQKELDRSEQRLKEIVEKLAALPTGYDAEAHQQAREYIQKHQEEFDEAQRLAGVVKRRDAVKAQAHELKEQLKQIEKDQQSAQNQLADLNFSQEDYLQVVQAYESAVRAENAAQQELIQAQGDLRGLKMQQKTLLNAYNDYLSRAQGLSNKEQEQRFKNALSTALQDFRTELNARMRPLLSDYASEFLSQMTGGRYSEIEIDEQYGFWLKEDGTRKSVISGGEKDVVNLSLRLALARLITEKAGVPLSLLMLDEVFGSLDTERRQHVLEVLYSLRDWFQQILVISHLEEINDAVDRSLWVHRDPLSRSSRVSERALDESQMAAVAELPTEAVNEGLFAD